MIKAVLLDIDGVLTDGKVTIDSNGNQYKTIDFKDVDAVFEMRRSGVKVGLITGESTPITLVFNEQFQPDFFYKGCKDKTIALKEILDQTGISTEEVCFVGDGKYDAPVMKLVKYGACPTNAIPEVVQVCNILLKNKGGDGCVWELLEWMKEKRLISV